jgi:hypothetical protein
MIPMLRRWRILGGNSQVLKDTTVKIIPEAPYRLKRRVIMRRRLIDTMVVEGIVTKAQIRTR